MEREHTVDRSRREEVAVSHHVPRDERPVNIHNNNKTLVNHSQ